MRVVAPGGGVGWAGLVLALGSAAAVRLADRDRSVERMIAQNLDDANEGHENPVYFAGEILRRDPGWRFYPAAFLWRATPVTLAGLVFVFAAASTRVAPFDAPTARRTAGGLLLFALVFTIGMSAGAKKFDRHLLPIHAPLDVLAAMGWVALADLLARGRRVVAAAMLASAVVGRAFAMLASVPYRLAYYNPLLGGAPRAGTMMMIGWGERLDEAGRRLAAKPGAPLVMHSWGACAFGGFYPRPTIETLAARPDRDPRWQKADYFVDYVNRWQRRSLAPEARRLLDAVGPESTIRIAGIE